MREIRCKRDKEVFNEESKRRERAQKSERVQKSEREREREKEICEALYTSLTKEDASTYLNKIPASLPKFSTQPLVTYLSTAWTLPALPTHSLAWLSTFFKSSHRDPSHSTIKSALQGLDESSMNQILAHIDAYIDKIVTEKLNERQDNVKSSQDQQENIISTLLNDNRLLVFIKNIVKNEKIVQIQPYELTEADIERIVEKVKSHLSGYLNEMQVNMKNENEIEFEKKFGTLKSHMAQLRQNPSDVEPNMDFIIEKLLESSEFSNWLITYLSNWNKDALVVQETENKILRQEFDALKAALIKEMEELPGIRSKLDELKYNQDELKSEFSSSDAKIQANLDKILNELSSRLAKLESSQESYIDERIRKQLLLVFEYPDKNEGNTSLADLILWIKSIFITKDYLEARLNELNKNDDEKLKKEFDRLGASLLDEILIKVRNEMTSLNIEHSVSEIDESSIVRVVKSILAVYDADKTGLPDYALETAGGQVISTRCTQFYQRRTAQISIFGIPLWYQSSTPRIAITPSVHPGQCWAFTGFPGYLVIQLSRSIHVTGFTVEHIPKTLAPNGTIDSAPKDFVVMGLTHEFDKEPAHFGTYEYQSEGEPLQYFPVQNKTIVVPYEFVEMRIDSNHGNTNYTCLYRIRVHGIPLP
uniref:CSON014409 protein n=1 Tax=Culicoides sonorensis TaxID=179676 RepID=A0A336LHJ6_CULSO